MMANKTVVNEEHPIRDGETLITDVPGICYRSFKFLECR